MPPVGVDCNRSPTPENGEYPSQDFSIAEWRVVIGQRIASSNEAIFTLRHQPVREESLVPAAEHDLTGQQF